MTVSGGEDGLAIGDQVRVGGKEDELFDSCLGKENAIKGVLVEEGEFGQFGGVGDRDSEFFKAEAGNCLIESRGQVQSPEALFDANFP